MNTRQKRRLKRKLKRAARRAVFIAGILAAFFASVGIVFSQREPQKQEEPKTTAGIIIIYGERITVDPQSALPAGQIEEQKAKEPRFAPLPVNMEEEDQRTVFDICEKYNVAFSLVMALIEHESSFDEDARSKTGDSGLMQINDINKEWLAELGFEDIMDPAQNVEAGVYILSGYLKNYETAPALMAYNMGEANAAALWEKGIFESEYSREIMAREEEFARYIDAKVMKGAQ